MDPAGKEDANGRDRDSKQKSETMRLSPVHQTTTTVDCQVTPNGEDGTLNDPSSNKSQERITGTINKDIIRALERVKLNRSSSFTIDCIKRTEMGLDIIEERLAEIEKITSDEVSTKSKRPWPTSSVGETQEKSADDNVKELTNSRTTGTKPKDRRYRNMEESICSSNEDLTQRQDDEPAKSSEESTPSTSQVPFPAGWFHQNLLSQPLTSWPSGSSPNSASTVSAPTQVTSEVETDMMSQIQQMLAAYEQVVSPSTDDCLSGTSDISKDGGLNHPSPRKKKVKGKRIQTQKKNMSKDRIDEEEHNLRSSLNNRQQKSKESQAKSVRFSIPKQCGPPNKGNKSENSQVRLQKPENLNPSSSRSSESSNEPGSSTESISECITTQPRVPILEENSNQHSKPRTRRDLRSIRRERSHQGRQKRGAGRGGRQLTPDEHWPRLPRSNHRMGYPTRYIRAERGTDNQEHNPSTNP